MNKNIKTSLQAKEFEALKDRYRVILRWATGVGKSKMTIDLVNHAITKYTPGAKINCVFLVAERSHIKNWEDEFKKWKLNKSALDIQVLCYASLHKLKDSRIDILVLDEAHHCFTDKRIEILETLNTQFVYALSATLSSQGIFTLEVIFGKFAISTVTLKEAINKEILSDPKVNIIEMTLDNTVRNQEILFGKGNNLPRVQWDNRKFYMRKGTPCVIMCTQYEKYLYFTQEMDYWKERAQYSGNPMHHNKWVNLGSQRKRYLGHLKTAYVKKFISSLPLRKRFICFCSSVQQAEELNPYNTISSKRPAKLNQQIINAFNAKKLHRLFAVGMATEGLNLVDIQMGIIVQLDGKERLFIQKFGRSMRSEDPVSYIFYFKDTQDEIYLKKALENIEEKYIQYTDINELINSQA